MTLLRKWNGVGGPDQMPGGGERERKRGLTRLGVLQAPDRATLSLSLLGLLGGGVGGDAGQ